METQQGCDVIIPITDFKSLFSCLFFFLRAKSLSVRTYDLNCPVINILLLHLT